MARRKKYMTPFYVLDWDINQRTVKRFDVIPFLIREYDETKKTKRKKTPVTFDEFREFINNISMWRFWGRCEYEFLIGSWPFGSRATTEKMKEFLTKNPNLDDHNDNIDFYNIVTSEMVMMDVYEQIKMNLDVVTGIVMDNLGIKHTSKKKRTVITYEQDEET